MRKNRAGLLLLVIFLLFLPVQAFDFNVSSDWAIAGGGSVLVIVHVFDGTSNLSGATVFVSSTNNTMGTVSPFSQITNSSGDAIFAFQPGFFKGNVSLSINVTNSSTDVNKSHIQRIDHSIPRYYEGVTYLSSVPVYTTTNISVRLKDDYGNIVDGLREGDIHNISFAEAIRSDSGFGAPGINRNSTPIDVLGNATVTYYVSTVAGDNIIRISAPATVVSNVTWIDIISTPVDPDAITSSITSPTDGTEALANGKDKFSITYTVLDRYKNPVPNIQISWSSSNTPGQIEYYTTNQQGYVFITYGPSTIIQYNITLTAAVTQNSSIFSTDYVSFIPEGTIFTLMADPENIPSLDVNNASFSNVRALLTDGSGRPKVGELVTFYINDAGDFTHVVENASFSRGIPNQKVTSAFTNVYGYAMVPLYPGRFNESDLQHQVIVSGVWHDSETDRDFVGDVAVTYKNNPVLSLKTSVSPSNITNGSIFNLTITLIGDGVLPHKPIDVMLADSRGSTMLQDLYKTSSPTSMLNDKEVYAKETIWDFTVHLNNETDRVGLVTFGMNGTTNVFTGPPSYGAGLDGLDPKKTQDNITINKYITDNYMPYSKDYFYSTLEIPLTLTSDSLRETILNDNVTPSKVTVLGGGTNVVPARYGLYTALKELYTQSYIPYPSNRIRGVILLLDDKITSWGDPLGPAGSGSCKGVFNASNPYSNPAVLDDCVQISQGGSSYCAFSDLGTCSDPLQNLATYANSMNTKIFVVLLPQKGCQIDNSIQALGDVLASSTGGRRYSACNAQDLDSIYYNISQLLMVYASVDTNMTLAFSNFRVTYNNITDVLPRESVMKYLFINGSSTYVTSWNLTSNITDKLLVQPFGPYPNDAIPAPINNNITYPYSLNQTDDWESGQLGLYVGNITIGQTWEAKLSFIAKTPGLIEILGNTSTVCISGICMPFPSLNISVTEAINATVTKANLLEIVDNAAYQEPSNSTEFVKVSWNTYYENYDTANMNDYSVVQSSYYKFSTDGVRFTPLWTQFGVNITTSRNITYERFSKMLDVTGLNGYIQVYVTAQEILPSGQYGNFSWGSNLTPFVVGNLNQPYIRIT